MKNSTLFILIAFLTITTLKAQSEFRWGAKSGVNFASISGDFSEQFDGRTGIHLGVLAELPLLKRIALQPEILYSSQGAKRDMRPGDGPLVVSKINYITVPVMAKYYISDKLSIMAGPQFGFLVSAKNESTGSGLENGNTATTEEDTKDAINTLELGVGVGLEYRLPFNLFLQARYIVGLSNVNDDSVSEVLGSFYFANVESRNRVFQLSAGFSF